MTVQELEDILARLPADMPVLVGDHAGTHIARVLKKSKGRMARIAGVGYCITGRCRVDSEIEEVEHGQYVVLTSQTRWDEPKAGRIIDEPAPVKIEGRWALKGDRRDK